ncbi:MmyB family transcriptional regulator [Nonomuraea muscovyensis]
MLVVGLRITLLDPRVRALPDWPVVAAEAVARRWMDAVHSPDDRRLAALVGELSEIWSWTGRRCGPATPPTGSWLPHRPGRHPGP